MSDLIEDIIRPELLFPEVLYTKEIAKQIRQQIGRELLQFEHVMTERGINNVYDIFYVTSNKINEVCRLEEE